MHRDYSDLLRAFSEAAAEYLVVGSYALALHLEPRYTKDLDIWVRPSAENSQRVFDALARFGAPLRNIRAEDFAVAGNVYQIGVEPVRVDVLTSVSGLEFDAAYSRRLVVSHEGMDVPFLSLEDILVNKEAAGRPQDLLDANAIRRKLGRGARDS